MKTNKIIRKESVNGGSMFSLTFALPVRDFDTEQCGRVLNTWSHGVNVTSTDLEVGDEITDQSGGEPIQYEHLVNQPPVDHVELNDRKTSDYRDAFAQKMSGVGEQ